MIQLATIALRRPVHDFVLERREAGRSYRAIAAELRDATGGDIDVTDKTVRAWALQAEQLAAAS